MVNIKSSEYLCALSEEEQVHLHSEPSDRLRQVLRECVNVVLADYGEYKIIQN